MVRTLTLRQKVFLARLALLLERLWPQSLALVGVINLFVAMALYDVLRTLPAWLHGVILVAWVGMSAALIWRLHLTISWPTHAEAARRLERDSGVLHQPLSVLSDKPATIGGEALWIRHRLRMERLVESLTLKAPHVSMMTRDPWGLRFWIFVPLVLGLVVSNGEGITRLQRAFSLNEGGGPKLEVWIAPPAATGLPAFVLDATKETPVFVPTGSVLKATVPHGWGRASLVVDGQSQDFDGDEDQHVQAVLDHGKRLEIRRLFQSLGRWDITLIPDQVPIVAFIRPPAQEEKSADLRVGVEASDDYGLTRLWLKVEAQTGTTIEIDLPVSRTNPRSTKVETRLNPEESGLAGQTVTVSPMARDTAGQESIGEGVSLEWPERAYVSPLAQALSQWRKAILQDPSTAPQVAQNLQEMINKTNDLASLLDMGIARRDLDSPEPDIADAQGLMLGAANRIENQAQNQIQQMLAELGEKLDQAMKQGNGKSLQQMAQRYADMLEKMMESEGKGGAPVPITQQDLEDMLGRLDQLSGQKGDAKLRQRLEALAEKLAEKSKEFGRGQMDPFGNQHDGKIPGDDNSTRIPGQNTPEGISHILNDIRNRVMDSTRPKAERDYLKRLLDVQ